MTKVGSPPDPRQSEPLSQNDQGSRKRHRGRGFGIALLIASFGALLVGGFGSRSSSPTPTTATSSLTTPSAGAQDGGATQSTTSTTPRTSPPPEDILWAAGHETALGDQGANPGNSPEWNGGIWVSGEASAVVTAERAYSGAQSMELRIVDANGEGEDPGVRPTVWEVRDLDTLPDSAYYSSWYYFPEPVAVADGSWWSVMQWKQVTAPIHQTLPTAAVFVESGTSGSMELHLRAHVTPDGVFRFSQESLARSPVTVPVGQWVHLECLYEWSRSPEGRISCWQDGQLLWDTRGIRTAFSIDVPDTSFPREWTLINYSEATVPSTHSLWVDEAVISSSRVGSAP